LVHDKSQVKRKAINLAPIAEHLEAERRAWDAFLAVDEADPAQWDPGSVKTSQIRTPLFEFSGACAGCGETPYLKLLTQLFGDRMIVANATGCSSIYGGNLPTTPWAVDATGRGPAWSNSLFEDNAEFGLGMRLGWEGQRRAAVALLEQLAPQVGEDLASLVVGGLDAADDVGLRAQRERVAELRRRLHRLGTPEARRLADLSGTLVRASFWIVGGDGWAYDIGAGGLDHVLGSGRDLNILVLDTEVYSNTGGQASKATPRGAVAKFAASGKGIAKKDLGLQAMSFGDVYVAHVALGASEQQTVKAFLEAEAHPGVSLVIAYSTCIAHGIEMSRSMEQQKLAVRSGHWPLYRYRPGAGELTHPFELDTQAPSVPYREYLRSEGRFAVLARSDPERAEELFAMAEDDARARWAYYEQLAGVERAAPRHATDGVIADSDDGGEP
jgi:pyruvate-ferredoxin/flavodoxin oxidoreductase